jgi:nucleoside-diphosphate-sugar epimerase
MRITITGCNGAIGRQVVAFALKNGHTIHGVDSAILAEKPQYFNHPNFSFEEADLREYEQVAASLKGADAVIHLAGIPQPFDYLVNTHNTYV